MSFILLNYIQETSPTKSDPNQIPDNCASIEHFSFRRHPQSNQQPRDTNLITATIVSVRVINRQVRVLIRASNHCGGSRVVTRFASASGFQQAIYKLVNSCATARVSQIRSGRPFSFGNKSASVSWRWSYFRITFELSPYECGSCIARKT